MGHYFKGLKFDSTIDSIEGYLQMLYAIHFRHFYHVCGHLEHLKTDDNCIIITCKPFV